MSKANLKQKKSGESSRWIPTTKKVCAWQEDLYDPKAGISQGGEGFPPKRRRWGFLVPFIFFGS